MKPFKQIHVLSFIALKTAYYHKHCKYWGKHRTLLSYLKEFMVIYITKNLFSLNGFLKLHIPALNIDFTV